MIRCENVKILQFITPRSRSQWVSFFDVFHSLTEVLTDPKARNLFEDCTRAPYSPPLHPGWRAINVEVKTNSVEEKRRLQRQCKEPLLAAKYMLPPPGLFLRDSLPDKHFSALFAQYNHIFPALVYHITSQHHAPALSN